MKQPPSKPEASHSPAGKTPAPGEVTAPAAPPEVATQPPAPPVMAPPTRPLPGRRPAAAAAPRLLTLQDAASLVGTMVGEHRLLSLVGKGGMGAVYEAEQLKIGRRDAVKILFPDLAGPENSERFLREAQAANRVKHPNIVQIYHFGTTSDGLLYLVMELLSGVSLDSRLQESSSGIERGMALQIARDVASCLAAVHKAGIVHRDLTPRNIMLVPKESGAGAQVKLLDFGIAKVPPSLPELEPLREGEDLTGVGIVFGTLEYMPPEQFRDARSVNDKGDVFSLAVILCEMMGARPFTGYANRLFAENAPEPKLPLTASAQLRALLRRMLAVEPARRPAMSEVLKTLDRELRPSASWRLVASVTGAVLAALLVGIFLQSRRVPHPPPAPPPLPATSVLRAQARAILNQAEKDPQPEIRKLLAIEVRENRLSEFCAPLQRLLKDPAVRLEAIYSVAMVRCADARPELSSLLKDQNIELRIAVAFALAKLEEPRAIDQLQAITDNEQLSGTLRLQAAQRWCELPDEAGCTKLAARLGSFSQQPPPLPVALPAHLAMAVVGHQPSLSWLHEQLRRTDQPVIRMRAAAALAQLRSQDGQAEEARALIEKLAADDDFTAALQAAQIHSAVGLDTLQRWLSDADKKLESRVFAVRAIAAGGLRNRNLPVLYGLLKDVTQAALPLTISAATAILRLLGDERDLNDWELALLGSGNNQASLVRWMNDESRLTSQQAVEMFGQLGAPQRQVFTDMLGHRQVGHTLALLRVALEDANSDVRIAGRRVLIDLMKVLQRSDPASLSPALVQQLKGMQTSSNANDQVVALSLSARLGSAPDQAKLLALLQRTSDVRVRELIVELSQPRADNPLFALALKDKARSVRYVAARTLAMAGSAAGKLVLEELLQQGGGHALAAYSLLKRLGFHPPTMNWMSLLSTEQQLPVRYEAVGLLMDLPQADILPLLRFALSDPAAVVRGQAGEVAAAMYRKHKQEEYREIIQILLTDTEEVTRFHAARLLRELAQPETSRPVTHWPAVSQPPSKDLPSLKPAAPSPLAPPSAAQLLMQSAITAERQGELQTAMNKLEALQQSYGGELSPRLKREVEQAIQRLKKQLGSYRLWRKVNGVCVPEQRVRWGRPGDNQVTVDGQVVDVFLYKGQRKDKVTLLCGKNAP